MQCVKLKAESSIALMCLAGAGCAATLAISGLRASAIAAKHADPVGAVADCSTRSQAGFPGAFTDPSNLVVGPLVLIGAGRTQSFDSIFGGNKFPLLVKAGHRVTLELSARTRRSAGLAYGPLPQGQVHLRDAHRAVTFIACASGERSGSSADGKPVTFWSGGVLANAAQCVPLLVWIDSGRSPRHAVIRLGVHHCA